MAKLCVWVYVKNLPAVQETLLLLGSRNSVPGSGKFAGEAIGYPLQYSWASLLAQLVKKSICNVGDLGSIPGLGRSLGEGKGYPLQYSGLENFMDCIVHGIAKSWTRLSRLSLSELRQKPAESGSSSQNLPSLTPSLSCFPRLHGARPKKLLTLRSLIQALILAEPRLSWSLQQQD